MLPGSPGTEPIRYLGRAPGLPGRLSPGADGFQHHVQVVGGFGGGPGCEGEDGRGGEEEAEGRRLPRRPAGGAALRRWSVDRGDPSRPIRLRVPATRATA